MSNLPLEYEYELEFDGGVREWTGGFNDID